MYSVTKTLQLKEYVFGRLKGSKIPVGEIIASNVYFTGEITVCGTYLYGFGKKFYLQNITPYKSEWAKYVFLSAEDLVFELVKQRADLIAMRDTQRTFSEYSLEILKEIDEGFYNRKIADTGRLFHG